jgi:phage-related protein
MTASARSFFGWLDVSEYGIFAIMAESAEVDKTQQRPVRWLGHARQDLVSFPDEVRKDIGFALWFAQRGEKHPSAKPLKGFKSAGVLEVVEDHRGDTYRAVYTVRLAEAIYVLHAFKKKSKSGIKTPKHEIELIEARLKAAQAMHQQFLQDKEDENATQGKS